MAVQLCQVGNFEPVKQHTPVFYGIESDLASWPSDGTSFLSGLTQKLRNSSKPVNQQAHLSQQKQYQISIEKQIQYLFVYRLLQHLDSYLVTLDQTVSFIVQQQVQLLIQFHSTMLYRLFMPNVDESPSSFSLS